MSIAALPARVNLVQPVKVICEGVIRRTRMSQQEVTVASLYTHVEALTQTTPETVEFQYLDRWVVIREAADLALFFDLHSHSKSPGRLHVRLTSSKSSATQDNEELEQLMYGAPSVGEYTSGGGNTLWTALKRASRSCDDVSALLQASDSKRHVQQVTSLLQDVDHSLSALDSLMTSLHQARRALAESSSTAASAPADEAVAQLKRVLTGALDGKHADLEASSLLLSASVTPPMALSASSGFSSSVSVADIGAAVSLEQRDILSRSIMRLTAPQSTEDKSALDRLCILGYQRSLAAMLLEKRDGNFAAALNDLKSIYKVGKEA